MQLYFMLCSERRSIRKVSVPQLFRWPSKPNEPLRDIWRVKKFFCFRTEERAKSGWFYLLFNSELNPELSREYPVSRRVTRCHGKLKFIWLKCFFLSSHCLLPSTDRQITMILSILFQSSKTGKLVKRNGGIPQDGNLTMHLDTLTAVVEQLIPPNYSSSYSRLFYCLKLNRLVLLFVISRYLIFVFQNNCYKAGWIPSRIFRCCSYRLRSLET